MVSFYSVSAPHLLIYPYTHTLMVQGACNHNNSMKLTELYAYTHMENVTNHFEFNKIVMFPSRVVLYD